MKIAYLFNFPLSLFQWERMELNALAYKLSRYEDQRLVEFDLRVPWHVADLLMGGGSFFTWLLMGWRGTYIESDKTTYSSRRLGGGIDK